MQGQARVEITGDRGSHSIELPLGDPDSVPLVSGRVGRAAQGLRVRVSARFARWHLDERYEDPGEALERLRELAALPDNVLPMPFSASARAIDSEPGSAMSRVFGAFESDRFTVSGAVIAKLRADALWDRVMLLAPDDDGVLRIAFIGDGMAARFGHRQARAAIGKPYDHDFGKPDRYFSRSSTVYQRVLESGEPCRHHVDSLIPDRQSPDLSARVQYDRIIAKARFVNGAPALLISSLVRPRLLPLLPTGRPNRPAAASGPARAD